MAPAALLGSCWSRTLIGEVLCHFTPVLGAALLVLGLAAAARRRPLPASLALVLAGLCLRPLMSLLMAPATAAGAGAGAALSVASANLWWGSPAEGRYLEWARRLDPDVLFLCELDAEGRAGLEGLATLGFSAQRVWPPDEQWQPDTIGRALVSKRPFERQEVHWPGPVLDVSIRHEGRLLRLLAAHPIRPGRAETTRERNRVLRLLAELAGEQSAVLVLGDLNLTEASSLYRELTTIGALSDSRQGRGWFPTWSVRIPRLGLSLPGLRLPIDHILLGPALCTLSRSSGPDLGSDHLPIQARVAWRADRE